MAKRIWQLPDCLGVDVGGVIVARATSQGDTSLLGDNPLDTPAIPGAFEALRQLHDRRFDGRIFVVSKAGPKVQARTLAWMEHHGFFERTGIDRRDVRFCLERSQKAKICRKLRITHFIDDRHEVHRYLDASISKLLFIAPALNPPDNAGACGAKLVHSWQEVLDEWLAHYAKASGPDVQRRHAPPCYCAGRGSKARPARRSSGPAFAGRGVGWR